jgi:hypothetical protein
MVDNSSSIFIFPSIAEFNMALYIASSGRESFKIERIPPITREDTSIPYVTLKILHCLSSKFCASYNTVVRFTTNTVTFDDEWPKYPYVKKHKV